MRITEVQLSNYRNYNEFKIEFGQKATVFIGKNGMGKTNLLAGIKQLMSFVFSRKKGEPQYEFIASSDRNVVSFKGLDARYGKDENEREFNYHYPIHLSMKAAVPNNENLFWVFQKESPSSGIKDSLFRKANLEFWHSYENGFGELPVFAYFSDSYPHVNLQISKPVKAMLASGNPLPRNVAYYKWDDDKNCTEIWTQYFIMQFKKSVLSGSEEAALYINAIKECLISFSKPISEYNPDEDMVLSDINLDFRGKSECVMLTFEDGRRIQFSELPQGYKRIFSMALDIASRSYLLNKNCDPSGVVLIDEIELHLHPSVARTVLPRFRRAFPDIQWIISTHSPLVLSAFDQKPKTDLIYKLTRVDKQVVFTPITNVKGVDYTSNLIYTMETPEDDNYLNNLKEAYEFWKAKGDQEKQAKIKESVREVVGENSLFYRLLK